jgi:tRNA A-37 threonylcarbamoyl transferase component Bud32
VADALTIERLAPAWDTPAIREELAALPQALALAKDGVIYRGRNTLTRLSVAGREVVAKAFPSPQTLIKRLQRFGREVKAVRAFDHASEMQRLGIGTPEPLAVLTAADGRGWYLCAWAEGYTTFRAVSRMQVSSDQPLCAALGAFIGKMHRLGAYHFDSTPGNILYRPDQLPPEFLVVDCNRMRFGRISVGQGLHSLVQLDWHGRLLESYCAERGWDAARIRWRYRLRLTLERWIRRLKSLTRPWRRKFDF